MQYLRTFTNRTLLTLLLSQCCFPNAANALCYYLPEAKSFTYRSTGSSDQVAAETLHGFDREFLKKTKGNDEEQGLKRAVSSVEALALVRLVLETGKVFLAKDEETKHSLAQGEIVKEINKLRKIYDENKKMKILSNDDKGQLRNNYLIKGIIPLDELDHILDAIRMDIQEYCCTPRHCKQPK